MREKLFEKSFSLKLFLQKLLQIKNAKANAFAKTKSFEGL